MVLAHYNSVVAPLWFFAGRRSTSSVKFSMIAATDNAFRMTHHGHRLGNEDVGVTMKAVMKTADGSGKRWIRANIIKPGCKVEIFGPVVRAVAAQFDQLMIRPVACCDQIAVQSTPLVLQLVFSDRELSFPLNSSRTPMKL